MHVQEAKSDFQAYRCSKTLKTYRASMAAYHETQVQIHCALILCSAPAVSSTDTICSEQEREQEDESCFPFSHLDPVHSKHPCSLPRLRLAVHLREVSK